MAEPPVSRGLVSDDCLKELARLFDLSENALDPLSKTTKEAKSAFESLVFELHEEAMKHEQFKAVTFPMFRGKVKTLLPSLPQ